LWYFIVFSLVFTFNIVSYSAGWLIIFIFSFLGKKQLD
jgi:hypothetical protein